MVGLGIRPGVHTKIVMLRIKKRALHQSRESSLKQIGSTSKFISAHIILDPDLDIGNYYESHEICKGI